jgi:hypothetical protein
MWKNININTNLIELDNGNSALIKCPSTSSFKGYVFWHPSKCIHDDRYSFCVSLGYTDDWKFRLIKYGKGKWNKNKKIEEIEITAPVFEEMFGIINDNTSYKNRKIYDILETHKPEYIEPVQDNLKDELRDEED